MRIKAYNQGQTALILILLTAATLIFLAITMNWGRIAQVKAQITVAANEGAALLASETASYGEMQKQTYLKDQNSLTELTGILLAIIMVVVAIIITIASWGAATASAYPLFMHVMLVLSAVMAMTSLVLQLAVVQPGITSLWNKLQKDQPVQQQEFEQGVSTALQSAVTDQTQIGDYFDSNANGIFGLNPQNQNLTAKDSVGRFAFFYTERLKMINKLLPPIPQVVLFYDQLEELMNGETCDENANDVSLNLGVAPNPACAALNCAATPSDPACTEMIPGSFQFNDTCTTSNPANKTTYNPYCDPCCQPNAPASCGASNCLLNNPYGASFPYLYDLGFQNYNDGTSFLDQFGRDQQAAPFTSLTPNVMSPAGVTPILEFPNGIYPFFWLMGAYSPEVDNINPAALQPSQYHWCTTAVAPAQPPAPTGFPDLGQLTLGYACTGADCCVNNIVNSLSTNPPVGSPPTTITITNGPAVNITSPVTGSYVAAGTSGNITVTATDASGTITGVTLSDINTNTQIYSWTSPPSTSPYTFNASGISVGSYTLQAVATDNNGVTANSNNVIINVINAPTVAITFAGGNVGIGTSYPVTVSTTVDTVDSPTDAIAQVQFFNNGVSLGNATASPFTYNWTPSAAGSYSLTAVATDTDNVQSQTSAAVTGTAS